MGRSVGISETQTARLVTWSGEKPARGSTGSVGAVGTPWSAPIWLLGGAGRRCDLRAH